MRLFPKQLPVEGQWMFIQQCPTSRQVTWCLSSLDPQDQARRHQFSPTKLYHDFHQELGPAVTAPAATPRAHGSRTPSWPPRDTAPAPATSPWPPPPRAPAPATPQWRPPGQAGEATPRHPTPPDTFPRQWARGGRPSTVTVRRRTAGGERRDADGGTDMTRDGVWTHDKRLIVPTSVYNLDTK